MRQDIKIRIDTCLKTGNANLNLENMKINDDEIIEIMEKIKLSSAIISMINLDNNNLSNKGAFVLTEALHGCHQITHLCLQFNKIGRDGALSLFSLKKEMPDLDILFHGNEIRDVGEIAEIESLALNK